MRNARIAVPLALGALLLPCAPAIRKAAADSITLNPSKDNSIYSEGTLSNAQGSIFAGTTNFGDTRRGLIAFDIASAIPTGSTIENVSLTLNISRDRFGGQVTLHRLLADWGEGSSNAGTSGSGAPATNGDATWQHRFYDVLGNSQLWTTPGGDFESIESSSQFVAAGTFFDAPAVFPSSPLMVQDVQHWLDVGENFGWLIMGDENRPSGVRFDSREATLPVRLPFLTIQYSSGVQPQWNVDADGSWGNPSNWAGGVPDSPDAVANFLGVITAPRTINLDGNRIVATINFDNPNKYTIAPGSGGVLTIGNPASSASSGEINVGASTHQISAKLRVAAPSSINIAASGKLLLSGGLSIAGVKLLVGDGRGGEVEISGPQDHAPDSFLWLNNSKVTLDSNAGTPATASDAAVANLYIVVNGPLVLNSSQDLYWLEMDHFDNGLPSVDIHSTATEFHEIRIHGGDPNAAKFLLEPSIFDSGLHPNSAIGIGKLVDAHGDPYVLIRPTRKGDLNLDGLVSIADFIDLASHFNQEGTWQEGDINGDSQVTIADFIDLAANFNQAYAGGGASITASDQQMLSAFAAAHGVTLVPEPATLSLLLLLPLARRRRNA